MSKLLAVAGHLPTDALADLDLDLPELRLRCLARVRDDRAGSFVALDPPVLERAIRAAMAPARLRELATRDPPVQRRPLVALRPRARRARGGRRGGRRDRRRGPDAGARAAMSAHQPGEALALGGARRRARTVRSARRGRDARRHRAAQRGGRALRRGSSTTPTPTRCCGRSQVRSTACCCSGTSPGPTRR